MTNNTQPNTAKRPKAYLALDLGAGSGRAIVGYLENGKIIQQEISRFENNMVSLNQTLYWDFLAIFDHIKKAITTTIQAGYDLRGIAVDTWGVDFGLLDTQGDLLSNPVCYRDSRTEGTAEQVFQVVSKEELYDKTGIQIMEINTLFQLFSLNKAKKTSLMQADKLLFTPDLVNYFLTGVKAAEYTIASTSQILNAHSKTWDKTILDKLNIPSHVLEDIVFPGDTIGKLRAEIAHETGAHKLKVFAVGSHDTASAIGAIPMKSDDHAFLSSGTWSIMGLQSDTPIISTDTLAYGFTNEGGVNGKILFMRNITGLWLLQRLMSEWEEAGETVSYEELLAQAKEAAPFQSIVNSNAPDFNNPTRMSQAIQDYCQQTNQAIPQSKGELVRCVMESLAMKYYFVAKKIHESSGVAIKQLNVVGGGSKNKMLNQMIADSLNIPVEVGLSEASALGNLMQQMIADNSVEDWQAGHQIIENSFNFTQYKPHNHEDWLKAIQEKSQLF